MRQQLTAEQYRQHVPQVVALADRLAAERGFSASPDHISPRGVPFRLRGTMHGVCDARFHAVETVLRARCNENFDGSLFPLSVAENTALWDIAQMAPFPEVDRYSDPAWAGTRAAALAWAEALLVSA